MKQYPTNLGNMIRNILSDLNLFPTFISNPTIEQTIMDQPTVIVVTKHDESTTFINQWYKTKVNHDFAYNTTSITTTHIIKGVPLEVASQIHNFHGHRLMTQSQFHSIEIRNIKPSISISTIIDNVIEIFPIANILTIIKTERPKSVSTTYSIVTKTATDINLDYHKFRNMAAPGVVTTIVPHSKLPPRVAHPRAFTKSSDKQPRTPRSTEKTTKKISTSASDIRQLIATANSTFDMLQSISPKIEELGTLLAQIQQRVTAIESKQGFNFNIPTSTQTHSPLRKVTATNKVTLSQATMFPFFQSGIASLPH